MQSASQRFARSSVSTRVFKIRDSKIYLHVHDEFKETDHPRAKGGEFTKKGTGESGATAGPITKSTGVKPKAAPGAVVVNPIALILKKQGYEKQKGSNIYKHPSGHEIEVHAASEGQKWLTGWTHSSGHTGSGAGRLDEHLESVSKTKPKTQTPPPKTEEKPKPTPPPKPEAKPEAEKPSTPPPVKTASGAKPPTGSAEDNKARETHQKRIDAILKEGGYVPGVATPTPKLKKMLTEVTKEIYGYMGVDTKDVTFTVDRMKKMKGPGGRKFMPGGYYQPLTNQISMGLNNSPQRVGGLAAHEIMHAKYAALKKAYVDEEVRFSGKEMKPDGTIREEYQDQFPIHTARPNGFWGEMSALEKDDGVTNYSTDYWKAAAKGTGTKELAVNETLAEMANLDWKGELSSSDWYKKSTSYKPLYEAIHNLYPAVAKTNAANRPPPPPPESKAPYTKPAYPKQGASYKKDGFDRAKVIHGRMVVGYGQFSAVISPTSGKWVSVKGDTGSDYDSLLKALEKYKQSISHLEKYK